MSWTDAGVGDDAVVKHVTSECVNSTPTTVASHAHFLVRFWLMAQGAALMLSTFASKKSLISICAMSSPSQSPPDAAHFAQHPALGHLVRLTIRALDDWLHRCSSRRQKQVSFSPQFITLKEKPPRHTDRTEAR